MAYQSASVIPAIKTNASKPQEQLYLQSSTNNVCTIFIPLETKASMLIYFLHEDSNNIVLLLVG